MVYLPYQLVQDFFHQQYVSFSEGKISDSVPSPAVMFLALRYRTVTCQARNNATFWTVVLGEAFFKQVALLPWFSWGWTYVYYILIIYNNHIFLLWDVDLYICGIQILVCAYNYVHSGSGYGILHLVPFYPGTQKSQTKHCSWQL